ncbi:phosphatidate cytidylyltransferase [Aquabacterium sp. A7-Y]|uniref:phosphatidate cytidylyltransferase n=1 Tax=Aquabacterium sp. A7-Y TaxID=1349605 RepID=UPI00223E3E60|nr:phosphatidate cytidylyltransferase [Aquabacterium sp. A7-Y]MCW7537353.1 phosphatidate cytidylyltransferase [Aquabacterium sp. A7-Y]
MSEFLKYLRALSAGEQIGALFLIVFGLLSLATMLGVALSIKATDEAQSTSAERFKRQLQTSWVMVTVFWMAWIAGTFVSVLLFGALSFFALREFITLSHTRRGDHRSLILAFFVVLPVQYSLVGARYFDLFTVFVPVYVFFAIPVMSAIANDPERFLERNANIQWGIMVCVYGLSHAPALLRLDFPGFEDRGAFLLFFLVFVVQSCMLIQAYVARNYRSLKPVAPRISASFSWGSAWAGVICGGLIGTLLYWITPFKPGQALGMSLIACAAGSFGHFVMKALKKDAGVHFWGNEGRLVTGAVGLLDRIAAICFAAPVFFHSVRWYFNI